MKENDHSKLLADVLGDDNELRSATLSSGLEEMRRTRKRRRATRTVAAVLAPALLIGAVVYVRESGSAVKGPVNQITAAQQAEETIPGTSIRVIGDEQLLELFKGRPVALIGTPGQQRLVFLDEVPN